VPDDNLASLADGEIFVVEDPRQRVAKYTDRLLERYAMPLEIRRRFLRVPLESLRHFRTGSVAQPLLDSMASRPPTPRLSTIALSGRSASNASFRATAVRC